MGRKGENIYKRKDGRWEARFIKERSADGSICYGYCYGRSYHEAKEKVNCAKAALLNHFPMAEKTKKEHFEYYCNEWLQMKRSNVKKSTFVKYDTILEKHIKPRLGKYFPETFSEILIEQFSYELLHEEKLSVKTVRDVLSVLHSVLDYTVRQNPSMRPIMVTYPKGTRKEVRVLSREEQFRFTNFLLINMDACKFGVLLALLTGLRIGEICALRWSDISLKERTICVQQTMQRLKNTDDTENGKTKIVISDPKSSRSSRIIPLNDYTAELCRGRGMENSDAYILTGEEKRYMEPRTLQYRMKQYTMECGLEGVHFHTLRHSFATRCVEVGFEIKSLSEILGHSSTSITMECYVHSSMELKRVNMEKLSISLSPS